MTKQDMKKEETTKIVWDESFALSHPIKAHGEECDTLTLRQPTAKDLRLIGSPNRVSVDAEIDPNTAVIAKYISELASIPMSSVDLMHPRDLSAIGYRLIIFFTA